MGRHERGAPPAPEVAGYRAPSWFVASFYGVLAAWTAVSIPFIGAQARAGGGDLLWFFMIAFVLAYSWYFSLRISYRVEVDSNDVVRLTSYGRVLVLESRQIQAVEGPVLPVGFLRLRLEREKAYVFCVATDRDLGEIIRRIAAANPEVKVKTG